MSAIEPGRSDVPAGSQRIESTGQSSAAPRNDEEIQSSPSDSPPLSIVSSATPPSPSTTNEHQTNSNSAAMSEIEDILRRLNRLSASIRRLGSQFRDSKAENFIDMDEHGFDLTSNFAKIVTLYVDHKFPAASRELRDRVAESVACRRNRLAYRRRHQQKLESAVGKPIIDSVKEHRKPIATSKAFADEPEAPAKADLSATSATSLQKQDVPAIIAPAPSNYSQSIAQFSAQSTEFKYPRAPRLSNKEYFMCPYCQILCPAKMARGKHWK